MTRGTITVAHIRAAWPTDAGKHIARALDTSVRNGRRIATTARVPRRWREHLLSIIDAAIADREAHLAKVRSEIHGLIRHEMEGGATSPERSARCPGDTDAARAPSACGAAG